jgi:prepilin-type N-terminal cleavage/methylation domain-containing protein
VKSSPSFNKKVRRSPQQGWSLLETLVAMVVIGIGLFIYSQLQSNTWGSSRTNSYLFRAGQLIEKEVESIRVSIAQDSVSHWPPKDTTYSDHPLKISRTVSKAYSPKVTTRELPNVRKIEVLVHWGNRPQDSLKVTTYVSKSF